MNTTVALLGVMWARLRANLTHLHEHPEDGYSTETVVVTAILVGLALAAIGDVIYNAVVNKAAGISF
jgi:hypothetical protein